jgi:uncharacterized protein Yka (UPF0111/DUF47 family)
LVVGEKNIFGELSQLVDIALETNTLMGKMFKMAPTDSQLTETLRAVQTLQRKASEIGFKVSEDITAGAVSPNVIDSLLSCAASIGDVVHTCLHISRELDRMAIAYSAGLEIHHTDWDSTRASGLRVFDSMIELIEKSLEKLRQALLSSDMAEIFTLRKEIQALEEQGDDIKDQGFDRLYAITPQLNYLEFYHYEKMLHNCEDILNDCSEFGSLIVSVVTSILK